MNTQIALPVIVRPEEVARKHSLGGAIELCAELANYELDKTLQIAMEVDKAQFSRWLSGTEGIIWPKLVKLMDFCGNDAPILWMLHQRGYDLNSIRKRESETQTALRIKTEELEKLQEENRILRSVINGRE
jgi:plasmid maintenance system antidote protein VapI